MFSKEKLLPRTINIIFLIKNYHKKLRNLISIIGSQDVVVDALHNVNTVFVFLKKTNTIGRTANVVDVQKNAQPAYVLDLGFRIFHNYSHYYN